MFRNHHKEDSISYYHICKNFDCIMNTHIKSFNLLSITLQFNVIIRDCQLLKINYLFYLLMMIDWTFIKYCQKPLEQGIELLTLLYRQRHRHTRG